MTKPLLKTLIPLLTLALAAGALAQPSPQPDQESPEFREGRGEFEMVLIHGLGASNAIWDGVEPYLAGTFKVWKFELAGHGKTQPVLDPTIQTEAARLADFLEKEDIAYPTLVGHGLGGMIALQYCLDNPAKVHRLIMIDAAPKQLATQEQKGLVGQALVENFDRFIFDRYTNMGPHPDISEQVLDLALRTHRPTFTSLLMSSFDYDVTDQLPSLTVPLLVIGSELLFPDPDNREQVLAMIGFDKARSLTFKRFERTGHYIMLERPPYTASVLMAFGVTADFEFQH
jgi:pimeloyl-ACP methyl ester carboxylesterase